MLVELPRGNESSCFLILNYDRPQLSPVEAHLILCLPGPAARSARIQMLVTLPFILILAQFVPLFSSPSGRSAASYLRNTRAIGRKVTEFQCHSYVGEVVI